MRISILGMREDDIFQYSLYKENHKEVKILKSSDQNWNKIQLIKFVKHTSSIHIAPEKNTQ